LSERITLLLGRMGELESLEDRLAQQIQLPDPPGIPPQITYHNAELILAEATEIYDDNLSSINTRAR
jgi:hypothetical protein